MSLYNKKVIYWADQEMVQGLNSEVLAQSWPEDYQIVTTDSFNDLLQQCAQGPIAVIVADATLTMAIEPLKQLKTRFPDILRFVFTNTSEISALQRLYQSSLIHKYFDAAGDPKVLALQIQEALTMIQLVAERNKFLELSITDPVTQLTNHRFFQQRFRQELQKAKAKKESLSLIMIDVDHFKLLNDQFGHPQGDMVLGMIAFEIKKQIPANASASRYGGEEFAILIPKCTHTKAFALAEQLRIAVTKISSIDFRLSISLGIASFPEHGLDADEILTIADHALYCAKRQGRNMSIVAGDGTY